MRTKTYNAGASAERTAILAKVRRMLRQPVRADFPQLLVWLLSRNERYNRKPRGIGK